MLSPPSWRSNPSSATPWLVEGAVLSPLARRAASTSLSALWLHQCRDTILQAARAQHQKVCRLHLNTYLPIALHCDADPTRCYRSNTPAALASVQAEHLDWPLPAQHHGTLCGMDAA
ncbi:hypothetical protein [Xanthomonas vasicola]|uniref:hypothetical protein n=1 Tax=Xanthomonas vasicola TaxID=56459 RepID=UPI0021BDE6E5|nr:hypothetical protein [Xanthomonas vasicola]